MSTKDWKNKELMENLSEKFGFKMNLEVLNEGEIPAGLKAYQDKQKAKKGDDSDEEAKDEKSDKKKDSSEDDKKPDFPDVDGDGDRKEPISKAQKEKKEKQNESRIMKIIKQEIRKQLKERK